MPTRNDSSSMIPAAVEVAAAATKLPGGALVAGSSALMRNERMVVLRDVMQHAMHFVRGTTCDQAFVIAAQQHFVTRVRDRRQQFGAILRAS